MRKFLIAIALALLLCSNAHAATDGFGATGLTGGTTGKLDAIDITLDGIDDGDVALVHTATVVYNYYYDDDNATAESSPDYIAPDKDNGGAYSGDGRWVLNGHYALTYQSVNGTSINEFSTDGTMAGNSDNAAPTEKAVKTYSDTKAVDSDFPGYVQRATFTYSDADTITITGATYHHAGTTEQMVYWDATITFDLGSGGSNSSSDDLDNGAAEWQYIYLDDSAIVTQGAALLDADCFLNGPTAPTWDTTDHAWMNGDDRCIFAVRINASNQILEFFHSGDFFGYADALADLAATDIDTTWTDVTLTIPGFARRGIVVFKGNYVSESTSTILYWRTNGQSGSSGHRVYQIYQTHDTYPYNQVEVMTDSGGKIEIKHQHSAAHKSGMTTDGWYLPNGM
jgi:hypothetical protein